MKTRIAIIGAGGFAREVAWLLKDINAKVPSYTFCGFLVSDLTKLGSGDSQELVLGDFDWLEANLGEIDALVFGIGNPGIKERLANELLRRFPHLSWPSLVHPTVQFDADTVQMGKGVVLCAGTVATVGIIFRDFSMVNLMCTIGHEAVIGPYAVLNPMVNISGGVEVGSGVLVGTGAQILQYVKVGEGATVGAGALAARDVAPGQTVVGIPARPRL